MLDRHVIIPLAARVVEGHDPGHIVLDCGGRQFTLSEGEILANQQSGGISRGLPGIIAWPSAEGVVLRATESEPTAPARPAGRRRGIDATEPPPATQA